ncbi:hypothetical protein BGY98DRAFT_1050305 [Russula aff. rugulosa BPL654]|nr:hypothetical protein BGY98DRAFT_1050305 [Russula aff. rugulosa BPL654]
MNPGFSSTNGVLIVMTRFNETKVNSTSGTVEIGAGLTWDQVYDELEPTGVNVVGGRVLGVGVAGLTLGGGFSYTTSQYGLTIDHMAGYELVLPNGTVINGGLNNFGIVTKFTMNSYPQSLIWGGFLFYDESQLSAVKSALVNFQEKNDTKGVVVGFLIYSSGKFSISVVYFYNAPTPSGIFDEFLAIPSTGGNVSTQSYSALVKSVLPLVDYHGLRVYYDGVPVNQYSPAVFDAFVNQTKFWGAQLYAQDQNATVVSTFEPFGKDMFSYGTGSAYPPDRSQAIYPSALTVQWSNPSLDNTAAVALRSISETIKAVALADGQNVSHAAKYVNYALFGTPLEDIYGGNLERLRKIRAAIDPGDVMGLAGGWKF